MKKLIFLLLSIVIGYSAFGQTDYYTGQTQVKGKNVTYSCRDRGWSYQITNVDRVFIGQEQRMSDGTPADEGPAINYDFGMNDPDHALLYRALRETFTPEQIAVMKDQKSDVVIYFYADPAGKIKDVSFYIQKNPATASTSPDQWFILEHKLKQYLTAKQEICKNYQFAIFFTAFKFDEL